MKKYADDYEIVIVEDEKGNEKKTTVYRGAYYEIDVDQQRLDQLRGLSRFLLLGTALLHVGAGFVANPGMYQFYISLPYVLSFLPLYFLAEGMLRIPKEKRPFRSDEVGLSFGRMQKASPFLFFLLVAGVVGALIFIIGFAADPFPKEWLYLLLETGALGCVFMILQVQKRIQVSLITQDE